MEFLKTVSFVLFTQAFIYVGVFFISGQLLPQTLAPVYAALQTSLMRTVVASILIFPLGNFFVAYAYAHFNPAVVAPALPTALVIVSIVSSILILNGKLSWQLVAATGVMVVGALWASALLVQKTS